MDAKDRTLAHSRSLADIYSRNDPPSTAVARQRYRLRLSLAKEQAEVRIVRLRARAKAQRWQIIADKDGEHLFSVLGKLRVLTRSTHRQVREIRAGARIAHFYSADEAYTERPLKWIYNLVLFIAIVALIIWGLFWTGTIAPTGQSPIWSTIGFVFKGFFSPNWNMFLGIGSVPFENGVFYLSLQTFAIAFLGTLIGSVIAVPFGFLASRKMLGRPSWLVMGILVAIRTFPEIVLGYVFITVFGFGAWTGMWVLAIHSIGMIGKMYADSLDSQEFAPVEALEACGATTLGKINVGVLPEITPNFLSTALYRLDLNIRSASILGLVGAGGIGQKLTNLAQNGHWEELGSFLLGLILMTLLVDFISTKLRKKLV